MTQSQDYRQQCDPLRRAACAEHVIVCTSEAYSKFDIPQGSSSD